MCEGRLTGFLPAQSTQEEIMQLATMRGGAKPSREALQ
jgi:hypothetical protein